MFPLIQKGEMPPFLKREKRKTQENTGQSVLRALVHGKIMEQTLLETILRQVENKEVTGDYFQL